MTWKILLLALIVSLIQGIPDVAVEQGVFVLTDDTIEDWVAEYQYALVEFYAPWCKHCQEFAPKYAQAAKSMAISSNRIPFAKIDASNEKQSAEKYEVKSYPTVKFFVNGEVKEYLGGREPDEIVEWLANNTQTNITQIESAEHLDQLKKDINIMIVYFGENEDEKTYQTFIKLAEYLYSPWSEILVAYTFDETIRTQNKAAKFSFVIFKQFDEGRNDFKTGGRPIKLSLLRSFVEENELPIIMPFNYKVKQLIMKERKAILVLCVNDKEESLNAVQEFAKTKHELKEQILLVKTGIESGLGGGLGQFLKLKDEDLPKMAIISEQGKQFFLKKDISTANILEFYYDYSGGKVTPKIKSEEVPTNQVGNIHTIVGKNFEQVVYDKSKDVLVMFHSPKCPHCQNKIADLFKQGTDDMIIAKVDSTQNDIKDHEVTSFPVVKFFPRNNKKSPIVFDDERTEQNIYKFLHKHKTITLDPYKSKQKKDDL